jgi:hypothetical protein
MLTKSPFCFFLTLFLLTTPAQPLTLTTTSLPSSTDPPVPYELNAEWITWLGWGLLFYDVASAVLLAWMWMTGRLTGGEAREREREWERWERRVEEVEGVERGLRRVGLL